VDAVAGAVQKRLAAVTRDGRPATACSWRRLAARRPHRSAADRRRSGGDTGDMGGGV